MNLLESGEQRYIKAINNNNNNIHLADWTECSGDREEEKRPKTLRLGLDNTTLNGTKQTHSYYLRPFIPILSLLLEKRFFTLKKLRVLCVA